MTDSTPDNWAAPVSYQVLPLQLENLPLLFREVADNGEIIVDEEEQDEEQDQKHPVLICRTCGHSITSENQRISISGSHSHTFFNPAGIVFELGCFKQAPGCALAGESSAEFSWFPGYLWRVALCSKCGTHLGWQFMSGEMYFYGLIVANLQGSS